MVTTGSTVGLPERGYEQGIVVTRGPALRWDAAGWGHLIDDANHAFAVRELTAVAGSDHFGTVDRQTLVESLRLASGGMLGAVGGGRYGTALELRYVVAPGDGQPTRIRLFITAKSVCEASPEPAVATAAGTVEAACAALPDGYEWQPADPADAEPEFGASAALIEVRRQEEVTPPLLPTVPAEFYYAAYRLQGDGSGWGQFLGMLARMTEPVVVSLLFAPTTLDRLEQQTIGAVTSQLAFHAATRQEQSFRGVGHVQGDANAAAVLPVWEHYLQSLRHCLLVRMTVRGSAGTARATAKGLASALSTSRASSSGRGGSPLTTQGIRNDHDARWARHSWVMRDVVPWGGHPFWTDDGAPNTLRRLPYLYSLSDAAAAAMLPVPDGQGAAGFPRARRVTTGRTSPETSRYVIEVNGGVVVAGDQYNVGQAGAVGPGARARDMTFVQGSSSGVDDPAALGDELERLRAHLRVHADDWEHDAVLGILAQAELKAKDGDGQAAVEQLSALQRLGNAGRWALTAATTIGTTVAAAALKTALGV